MRAPDQEERADEATASEAFGDGFGSVEQGDLNDGYGTDDFYDESYSEPDDEVDADDDADETFDDAPEDQGGFGQDETTTVPDEIDVDGDGDSGGPLAVPAEAEADEDESGNILEEILDDVLGGDVEVGSGIIDAYGTDGPELLTGLDDGFDDSVPGLGDDDGATSAINEGDGFDTPFDQPDVGDVADFVSESDFDLNADGHVDHGDLREAAHPFDFHADG